MRPPPASPLNSRCFDRSNCICCASRGLGGGIPYWRGSSQGSLQVRDFALAHVRLGSDSEVGPCDKHVCSTPESRHHQAQFRTTLAIFPRYVSARCQHLVPNHPVSYRTTNSGIHVPADTRWSFMVLKSLWKVDAPGLVIPARFVLFHPVG
jgi:hypothetical protein